MYSTQNTKKIKWPVSAGRIIEAPSASVWEAISKPGNLEECHPFCERNPIKRWPGVGSMDTIYYYSGWVLQREFINWFDGRGYDLLIGRKGGDKSFVSWRIMEDQENKSKLTITIFPHVLKKLPAPLRWLPYRVTIKPSLTSYLESVVRGFEWFITTGKPVRKNQFGSHKWFSKDTS